MPRLHFTLRCRVEGLSIVRQISTRYHQMRRLGALLTTSVVDYKVTGPSPEPGKERVIMEGEKERQGDFVFTATTAGEYRFCFDNTVSTFTDKIVDFEISVCLSIPI